MVRSVSFRLGSIVVATATLVVGATAGDALAQGGPGAERYEVTITPPKRADSDAGDETTAPPPGAAEAAAAAALSPATAAPAAKAAPSTDNVLGATEAARPAAPPSTALASPNAPLRTLQVGAFRQQASAEALRDQLAPTFQDVAIVEISSGGEPLYRVNVGRLPKGPELAALRKRLADAGFPAFDVPMPKTPSSR